MNKSIHSSLINKVCYFVICVFPASVFANGETPVSEGLSYIVTAMYGATGIAIATIAIMIVGLLCLGHFLNWSALGKTIIGISLIFGAGAVVNGIVSLIHTV
jgi:type IV secretory pathway VirB2 component (pilin)